MAVGLWPAGSGYCLMAVLSVHTRGLHNRNCQEKPHTNYRTCLTLPLYDVCRRTWWSEKKLPEYFIGKLRYLEWISNLCLLCVLLLRFKTLWKGAGYYGSAYCLQQRETVEHNTWIAALVNILSGRVCLGQTFKLGSNSKIWVWTSTWMYTFLGLFTLLTLFFFLALPGALLPLSDWGGKEGAPYV